MKDIKSETLVFKFKANNGCKAHCQLEIDYKLSLVICTELGDNPGTSITNSAQELATLVCQKFAINPQKLVWIERYTNESYNQSEKSFRFERNITEGSAESCSLATFSFADGKRFTNVDWRYISPKEMAQIRSCLSG